MVFRASARPEEPIPEWIATLDLPMILDERGYLPQLLFGSG